MSERLSRDDAALELVSADEERVLVFAPLHAAVAQTELRDAGIACHLAADLDELARSLAEGAAALLLGEEALLSESAVHDLATLLRTQPAWSDVPVVAIAGAARPEATRALEQLGNVTVLEPPIRSRTLVSALRAALRARRRQYQVRDQMQAIERTERQLDASEERLHIALGAAHGGVFDHDFATGRTYWSPELEALYGGAAPGDPEDDRVWIRRVHPDDRERVKQAVRAALQHGEYAQDYRVVWPDGSTHWLQTRAGVVFDAAGAPLRMFGVQLDVTESKHIEQSRALLVGIVESSDDAMITKSLTGIITSWNRGAQHLFGYTAEEAIGRSIKLLIPPDRHAEEDEILRRLCNGERIDHYDTIRRTKDGRAIDISLTISAVRDANGELIGASKVARDVTGRKAIERLLRASEAALRETDRRKDEFLAMLAHELRNPLAPIRNAVGLLATQPVAELDRVHAILDRQVAQLSRLIEDLLDVSRISRGQIPLAKEPLLLTEVVEMAIETARPLLEQHQHALSVALPDEPIPIEGDRARLVQVVGNLLTNAAKFTPAGGHVSVTAHREAAEVAIAVRDDGIGIAKDALPRVFDLFAQEETSLARTQGGLGIGLTLVRDLVALHGGRVEVESAGRGSGTEVRVHVPIATEAPVEQPAPDPVTRRPAAGLRILIAEDHRDTADSLRMLLERQGYEVRVTRDGREAVDVFAEFKPAVALLDIGLPELDGYGAARRIRSDECGDRAVLIALSGYGRDEDKRAAREAGFDHHLTKPVDLRRLVDLFPR